MPVSASVLWLVSVNLTSLPGLFHLASACLASSVANMYLRMPDRRSGILIAGLRSVRFGGGVEVAPPRDEIVEQPRALSQNPTQPVHDGCDRQISIVRPRPER